MIQLRHVTKLALCFAALATVSTAMAQVSTELPTLQQPGVTNSSTAKSSNRNTSGSITPGTTGRRFLADGSLLVGQGDLLHIEVFNTPEYSQDVRIDTSGDAHVSGIGDLHFQDLTLSAVAELVKQKLQSMNLMLDPQVTASIQDLIAQGIAVRGEFKSPGVYSVVGPRRLSDILSLAGGVTELCDGTAVIRRGDGSPSITVSTWKDGDTVLLNPGDEITAIRAGIVYVVGNVARPGGFPLNRPTTIVQALTLASGLMPSTAENSVRVFRKTPDGTQRVEISVRLHDILHGKQADFPLIADDIVYIPGSPLKAGLKVGATAAVALATNAYIYTR